jgi:Common central domain of tyrosinase
MKRGIGNAAAFFLFLAVVCVAPVTLSTPGPLECPTPTPYNCAPVTGTPIQYPGDQGPMRVRKSIWALSEAEIAELRLAFERFQKSTSDKIGYQAIADIHCWNCATPGRHIGSQTGNPTPPEDIHATWSFLPFHRAYLHTLEKILGDLVDNPRFALPYWDWDTPDGGCSSSHQQLPPPYANETVSASGKANSLWNVNRGVTTSDTMCPAVVGNHRMNLIFDLYDSFSLFFGTEHCGSALWRSAHGYVHIWTGGMVNYYPPDDKPVVALSCPDMGMLGTAGRDPIFFAHHANVDRLWDLWIERNGTPTYPEDFLKQSWNFWLPGPGQNGRDNPQYFALTAADGAFRADRMKYTYAEPSCDPSAPVRLIGEGRIKVDRQGSTLTAAAKPQYTLNGKTGSNVVLHLDEIVLPTDQAVVLRVFVGDGANAEKIGCTSENVVESELPKGACPDGNMAEELYLVPKGHQTMTWSTHSATTTGSHSGDPSTHVPEKTCAWISLCPDSAKYVIENGGNAKVSLVPVMLFADGSTGTAPAGIDLEVSKPYFTVED